MAVRRPDESNEYFFHEGCFILEVSNTPEDPALSVARARVPPGQTTRWHYLRDVTERYLILSGDGEVDIGSDPPCPVAAGCVVIIPAGTKQRIRNTGSDDLVFWALCTPRFTPACYVDAEPSAVE